LPRCVLSGIDFFWLGRVSKTRLRRFQLPRPIDFGRSVKGTLKLPGFGIAIKVTAATTTANNKLS